jgi:hypothetical protein
MRKREERNTQHGQTMVRFGLGVFLSVFTILGPGCRPVPAVPAPTPAPVAATQATPAPAPEPVLPHQTFILDSRVLG